MSNLPSSWGWSTIGDLAVYIQRGKSPKYAERSDLPVVNQKCVRWNQLEQQHLKFIHPDQFSAWDSARYIRAGDVLWNSTGTGTVGRAYLVREADCIPPKVVDSHVTIVRHAQEVDPRYLFNWIKSPGVQDKIEEMCDGTTNQIELSRTAIASTVIPTAPAAEQTRIADKLDALLARIQACNDRLDAIPALLKRFRQAVLKAASSGALTEDWRESQSQRNTAEALLVALMNKRPPGMPSGPRASAILPSIPANWRWTNLHFLLAPDEPFCYGVVQPGVDDPRGIPLIRAGDLKNGTVLAAGLRRISAEVDGAYKRSRLQGGELLVTVVGAGIGESSIAPPSTRGFNIARAIAKLPIREVSAQFVHRWLLCSTAIDFMKGDSREVARPTLNLEELKTLPVPLPPLDEQAEIVLRVEALFQLADRIEVRHRAAFAHAQRLTPITLAKAFRGELVQQDPNDEPASVLLQRIAKAPATALKTQRGRPQTQQPNKSTTLPAKHPDWAALPPGVWAASTQTDEHATTALLIAVLKAWGQPIPQDQARLAAVLCLQPRLFTAALPAHDAAPWRRLVGAEAEPLPASVAALHPAVNTHWRRALAGLRARGDLVASGSGPQATWALGPGAHRVDTAGWPDSRAGWVVAYLRAHGIEAVLPLLSPVAADFVHACAA